MTKEKFEAQMTIQPNIRQKLLAPSPLERLKAMCQVAEFDCSEAEMRSKDKLELAAYYRGRASAFNSVLSLIRELESANG